MNIVLLTLIAFLLPVGVAILVYFTVIKKKICDGDLHLCPASGVSVCVKSGTTANDWQGMCTKLSQGPNGFRSNKGPLRTGPGIGPCVRPTTKSITDKTNCRNCLQHNTQGFWNDTQGFCGDASGGDNGVKGDIVAFYYGIRPYSCDNPAEITDCM